jgi:hypothetical protein
MTIKRVLPFLVALVFLAMAVEAIRTGRTRFGMRGKLLGPWTFRRESQPVAFWLAVGSYLLAAVLLAVIAFYGLADGS